MFSSFRLKMKYSRNRLKISYHKFNCFQRLKPSYKYTSDFFRIKMVLSQTEISIFPLRLCTSLKKLLDSSVKVISSSKTETKFPPKNNELTSIIPNVLI